MLVRYANSLYINGKSICVSEYTDRRTVRYAANRYYYLVVTLRVARLKKDHFMAFVHCALIAGSEE